MLVAKISLLISHQQDSLSDDVRMGLSCASELEAVPHSLML